MGKRETLHLLGICTVFYIGLVFIETGPQSVTDKKTMSCSYTKEMCSSFQPLIMTFG